MRKRKTEIEEKERDTVTNRKRINKREKKREKKRDRARERKEREKERQSKRERYIEYAEKERDKVH